MAHRIQHLSGLLLLGLLSGNALGQEQQTGLLLTTSFDSLKGKFGQTQETRARSITVAGTVVGDGYRASVYVPYISLEGPGTLVGGTVTGGTGAARRKVSGLGDVLASLSVDVVGSPQSKGFALAATGLVKLPTGDEKEGLGTGKADYAVQADNSYRFANGFGLSAAIGRQFYGQTDTLRLLDGNYSTVGVNFPLSANLFINLNTSRRDKLINTAKERRERTLSAVYALDTRSALQLGYTTGSTSASPDDVLSLSYITQID